MVAERRQLQDDNKSLREQVDVLRRAFAAELAELESLSAVDSPPLVVEENALLKRLVAEHALFLDNIMGSANLLADDCFVSRESAAQELEACRLHCMWMLALSGGASQAVEQRWSDRHVARFSLLHMDDGSLLVRADVAVRAYERKTIDDNADLLADMLGRMALTPGKLEEFAKATRPGHEPAREYKTLPQFTWPAGTQGARTVAAVRETNAQAGEDFVHVMALGKEAHARSTFAGPHVPTEPAHRHGVVQCHTFFKSQSNVEPARRREPGRGTAAALQFKVRQGWFFWDEPDEMRMVALLCIPETGALVSVWPMSDGGLIATKESGLSASFLASVRAKAITYSTLDLPAPSS